MIEYLPLVLTGLGLTASILYYTMTLRNANKTQQMQLETRQGQFLMQIYNHFDTKEKQEAFLELWNWEWSSFEEFWEKYGSDTNSEQWSILLRILLFYEGLGTLVKTKKLSVGDIYLLLGGLSIGIWEKFIPILDLMREKANYPRLASETEYLYYELLKYQETNPK